VEIAVKRLLLLHIDAAGREFLRFLFPPLSFFRALTAAPLSHPHTAEVGLSTTHGVITKKERTKNTTRTFKIVCWLRPTVNNLENAN
jgi:hypothetical protein